MNWNPPQSAKYLGSGLQLTVTVLLGVGIGYWIDKKIQSLPWFTLIGSALGFFAGLYLFLKEFSDQKNDDHS